MTAEQETAQEMSFPVFTNFDPSRLWVIVCKDYEEGTRAMWREWDRFTTQDEAREALRMKRAAICAYEDRTGYETMIAYKIVQQDLS
jgi:hypothetical protein